MTGFHHFSPRPYGNLWEPQTQVGLEFSTKPGWHEPSRSPWSRVPAPDIEVGAPKLHPHSSPAHQPLGRGYNISPRESHSLTQITRRPSDRARKNRFSSQSLDDACGEVPTKSSRAWLQRQQSRLSQSRTNFSPAQGDSPPPYSDAARTSSNAAEALQTDESQTVDRWAVPVASRRAGLWSPCSILTDKSSAPSKELRTKRDSRDQKESLDHPYSQPSGCSTGRDSRQARQLQNKLEEAVMTSRDQKILALVLSRLRKAQRMRELQQQAAVAWEELKRSDQKVQLTLERERQLLLQQSQAQWQGQKESAKPHRGSEQPRRRPRDSQEKSAPRPESEQKVPADPRENKEPGKLDDKMFAQAELLKQSQVPRLQEQERVLQSLRDLNRLQLRERLEAASQRRQLHTRESQKKARQSNLSSLINFQARKVLMDCQAKAEELLRKLSLEQLAQRSQETQGGPMPEQRHRERHRERPQDAPREEGHWRARESDEQRQARKRMELTEQKIRQARGHTHKTTRDRAQHLKELSIPGEQNHHIMKLKAEKEEKCHIEGIKEAIKRKEQMSQGREPSFQELQKVPRTSNRDSGTFSRTCCDQEPAERLRCTCTRRGAPTENPG